MRQALFASVILLFSVTANAQLQKSTIDDEEKIFIKVEQVAAPENRSQWESYIKQLLKLTPAETAGIPKGEYVVNVAFIVNVHGNISKVTAVNDPGYGLAEKAERHIRQYKGNWKAANQCGRLVNAYLRQSVRFFIS